MRFAKVGDRVRIKNNLNGTYKDMTGEVVCVLKSGMAKVAIDSEFHKNLRKGYTYTPYIQIGNYEVLVESVPTLEVE